MLLPCTLIVGLCPANNQSMLIQNLWQTTDINTFINWLYKNTTNIWSSYSLRTRCVNMRILRILGRGQHILKDSVRLIARFYSQSVYYKPLVS